MKATVIVCATVVTVAAIVFGSISLNVYVTRDKVHVYTPEETFSIECSKRGGNPRMEVGNDYTGEKEISIKEFKCEGVNDVHN